KSGLKGIMFPNVVPTCPTAIGITWSRWYVLLPVKAHVYLNFFSIISLCLCVKLSGRFCVRARLLKHANLIDSSRPIVIGFGLRLRYSILWRRFRYLSAHVTEHVILFFGLVLSLNEFPHSGHSLQTVIPQSPRLLVLSTAIRQLSVQSSL